MNKIIITIIALLSAILLPSLQKDLRAETVLEKWQAYSNNIRNDADLAAYYDF